MTVVVDRDVGGNSVYVENITCRKITCRIMLILLAAGKRCEF